VQEWTVNDQTHIENGLTYTENSLVLTADGTDSPYTVQVTFVQIGTNTTVTAGENGEIIAATVSGTSVLDNVATGFTTNVNAIVTLTVQPAQGYEVAYWAVNGQSIDDTAQQNSYSYTVTETLTGAAITIVFQPVEYTVSWSGGGHSTVTADGYSGSSASIRGGTSVTFTAVSEAGYVVSGWTVNGTEQSNVAGDSFTWTVPTGAAADTSYTVQPVFTMGSYTVSFEQPVNGTLSATSGDTGSSVTGGTNVTFTATPNANYTVSGWTVNGTAVENNTSNKLTVTVNENTAVTVTFVPTEYTVTYAANNSSGTVTTASGESPLTVERFGSVTFTATPDQYYMVDSWTVTGTTDYTISTDRETLTLNSVEADITVTANFAESLRFQVGFSVNGTDGNLTATADGTAITPAPGSTVDVVGGTERVFTADPDNGYMVAKWTVNGTEVTRDNMDDLGVTMSHHLDNTLTISSLEKNVTITVEFEVYDGYEIPTSGTGYTVSVTTIMPSEIEAGEVRKGGDVTFTVSPNSGEGYTNISTLIINGYDCIAGTVISLAGCDSVSAVANSDGSYTVTILGVSSDIGTTIEAHKLEIGKLKVPAALENIEHLDTVEEIQTALHAAIT
ncbi:MAG: hypothetical protein LUG17_06260, partial [Clostridiales bacterium]|nr:hypothetical protein [Clostridiales bacterium]